MVEIIKYKYKNWEFSKINTPFELLNEFVRTHSNVKNPKGEILNRVTERIPLRNSAFGDTLFVAKIIKNNQKTQLVRQILAFANKNLPKKDVVLLNQISKGNGTRALVRNFMNMLLKQFIKQTPDKIHSSYIYQDGVLMTNHAVYDYILFEPFSQILKPFFSDSQIIVELGRLVKLMNYLIETGKPDEEEYVPEPEPEIEVQPAPEPAPAPKLEPTRSFDPLPFSGISASSGVAISHILKLDEAKIDVKDTKISDVAAEIKIFQDAVKKTVVQIEQIKDKAKRLKAQELEILDAHISIATDPALEEDTIKMIKQNYNAAYALKETARQNIAVLLDTKDEYLMARAADIQDATTRILKNILNINILDLSAIDKDVVLVAHDLTPSDTAQLNEHVRGFVTKIGSRTSHSAIMARSLGIPAIVGVGSEVDEMYTGDEIVFNGDTGLGIARPTAAQKADFANQLAQYEQEQAKLDEFLNKPAITKDGHKVIVAANVGSVEDTHGALKANADEIGLVRSEFLYMDAPNWPTEEEQFQNYKKILELMNGKKVVVRTLDIGGDKTLKYFEFHKELNPFLGYRAIRLSLDKTDIFQTQLRALIRASQYGNLAIMFPMIATVDEFLKAKAIFNTVYKEVRAVNDKIAPREAIKLGIMVEIPVTAIMATQFAHHVDFFSIGTNDLIQYSMAADRMNEKVSYLYQPLNPGILKLIKMTIDAAHKHGKLVGMCGEMAGDIHAVPILIGLGLDEFSMSAGSINKVKKLISTLEYKQLINIAQKTTLFETEDQVISYLEHLGLILPN